MNVSHPGHLPHGPAEPPAQRLARLRGPVPQRSLDARALAALAANPGCRRRALLDAAGVDKAALADRLGSPAPFGQSPFAIVRGNVFESRVKADGYAELLLLLQQRLGLPEPGAAELAVPDLLPRAGTAVRTERTRQVLADAAAHRGRWTLLDHPMLCLEVAGSPAFLEPDAVVVRPDGRWTVVEIKSFPVLDGSADPAKVGAAARQAAVYVLALQQTAAELAGVKPDPDPYAAPEGLAAAPDTAVLLVCPRDFSNRPTAAVVDVRRELSVTRRQLQRMTGIEQLLEALPEGVGFDLSTDDDGSPVRSTGQLGESVAAVPAAYSPDCLSTCELGFHCRQEARCAGAVEQLGRAVRGELGSLRTVGDALAAAAGAGTDPADEAAARLARAAALRAEALGRRPSAPGSGEAPGV
ncbi:hypothetical protein [Peterkaempfera griseoplana]|uniref:hypothetical protein n=1 Tax=Peterkaempfera griseoplana TaxID=66896 RepID=UPI0006E182BF|nr:hypothetical protein [Peterkaempfera griseoplana]